MAAIIAANLIIAYRLRPPFRPMSLEQQNLERYRSVARAAPSGSCSSSSVVIGVLSPASPRRAAGRPGCCAATARSSGSKDPQFGIDISFYVFDYPF